MALRGKNRLRTSKNCLKEFKNTQIRFSIMLRFRVRNSLSTHKNEKSELVSENSD